MDIIGQQHLGIIRGLTESEALFSRAKKVLAGGISSSARATTIDSKPFPVYIVRGRGSRIFDADGNEYIDHLLSYGSVILGHCDPGYTRAVSGQLAEGTMFGTCNLVEVELAAKICSMVPCADLVRYANSGSEAVAGAIRVARGYTGKNKILKFEGHYHGWMDLLAVSNRPSAGEAGPYESPRSIPHSAGIPAGVVDDVIICPWNEPEILKNILNKYHGQIAAVIAEPIVANNACTMPVDGYLETLREECTQRDIVLIYDEIVTGFRVAPGGAQQYFGVDCDIAVYSKALGGGLPISAFAGRRKYMDLVAANKAKHGGTYNGNPVCAAAALYTLEQLDKPEVQDRIRSYGEKIIEAIRRSARDNGVSCIVQGMGSMFQVIFIKDGAAPKQYRDLFAADTKKFSIFRHKLLENGVHINNSGLACWFISAAHTGEDAELTAAAIDDAMKGLA
jgi:glutamate-1-semialdehyde 2,1-aminomutase